MFNRFLIVCNRYYIRSLLTVFYIKDVMKHLQNESV